MEPAVNRNSLGSRAGTAGLKFGGGTGSKVPQSRLGTAGGVNALGGVGANVDIKDRPLTGIGGINGPAMGGTQRIVYDKNYYITKYKEKLTNIQDESTRLRNKTEQINKEQALYNKLETRVEELVAEVKDWEGQLADYNLAIDKARINTRPEDVSNSYKHVKSQN